MLNLNFTLVSVLDLPRLAASSPAHSLLIIIPVVFPCSSLIPDLPFIPDGVVDAQGALRGSSARERMSRTSTGLTALALLHPVRQ